MALAAGGTRQLKLDVEAPLPLVPPRGLDCQLQVMFNYVGKRLNLAQLSALKRRALGNHAVFISSGVAKLRQEMTARILGCGFFHRD